MTFTTASGLLPAGLPFTSSGAERSWFGNGISSSAVRLYVSKRNTPVKFTTASLGKWASIENNKHSRLRCSFPVIRIYSNSNIWLRRNSEWSTYGIHDPLKNCRAKAVVRAVLRYGFAFLRAETRDDCLNMIRRGTDDMTAKPIVLQLANFGIHLVSLN